MFNPFSTTLKYNLNPEKQTITLRPTLKGTIKAFMPVYVLLGALYVMSRIGDRLIQQEYETTDDPQEN